MNPNVISRDEILRELRRMKEEFRDRYGVTRIGIFGSAARSEIGSDSDVDIVVRIDQPDLFMLVGIKNELEERLHRPVDLVTYRETMNQFLKKRIDSEAVYA